MSLRFRISFCALLIFVGACDREDRDVRGSSVPHTAQGDPTQFTLRAGGPMLAAVEPRATNFEKNAFQIAQGQRLFQQMNCSGCHAHGGGGMGPALMDDQWRYGGDIRQIVQTIDQGRPNGMPAWRGRLTGQQMWQLAAYVRSLSAQPGQDALPARGDELSNSEPLTLRSREDVINSSPASVQGTVP